MAYKENCKAEGEIMTRFKIARLFFLASEKQREIARRIGCHYNTVNRIIRACQEKDEDPRVMEYLATGKRIEKDVLDDIFSFLGHGSRRPKSNKRCLDKLQEKKVPEGHKLTKGGVRRTFKHLKRKGCDMGIITISRIKGVFKRHGLKAKRIRTYNGERRALYDYDEIGAFEYLQHDTKEILDKHSLPKQIYERFRDNEQIPTYQWTIVDAKTKTRFLAWSYTRNSHFGLEFLKLVILWLRSHGITGKINVQFDGGAEFCSMSETKTGKWNKELERYDTLVSDHGGSKWKQNLVERTHRTDDEEFYCPRGHFIDSKSSLIIEGQKWIIYYNQRGNDGIGMDGLSPQEKLKILGIVNAEDICRFPAIILDDYYRDLIRIFCLQNQQPVLAGLSPNVLTPYLVTSTSESALASLRCVLLKIRLFSVSVRVRPITPIKPNNDIRIRKLI